MRHINSEQLDKLVVNNPDVKQCVIEVYKHDCPACKFNGTLFDVISQKMYKHGYLNQMPLYRMTVDNLTPYLGRFKYTPMFIYLKKKDDDLTQISEIETMHPPGESQDC